MTITTSRPLEWTGDPTVLVYAVRYALTSRGSHAPELMRQTLTTNADQLPPPARRAISQDIQAWLDADHGAASAADRAAWTRAHQALQVRRAQPNVSRKDLRR